MVKNKPSILNLNAPYPYLSSARKKLKSAIAISVFVFLFLYIFQPFQINLLPSNHLLITLGYGLSCFIALMGLYVLIEARFVNFFNESNWTVAKEIAWSFISISVIGFCNFYYSTLIGLAHFNISNLLLLELYTFAIGFFPVTVYILIKQKILEQQYNKASIHLNQELALKNKTVKYSNSESIIHIDSENIGEELKIEISNLIYIQSADNYINIYYLLNNQLKSILLRNSLKKVNKELSDYDNIFRCHKSYLVNLDHLIKVSGNAQGYKLKLKHTEEFIPVSRSYNDFIKSKLQ